MRFNHHPGQRVDIWQVIRGSEACQMDKDLRCDRSTECEVIRLTRLRKRRRDDDETRGRSHQIIFPSYSGRGMIRIRDNPP